MSYIRFDQLGGSSSAPMITADGRITGQMYGQNQLQHNLDRYNTQYNQYLTSVAASRIQNSEQRTRAPQTRSQPIQKLDIRGINRLISKIGYPDVVDGYRGGIAIWSRRTLHDRGYPFLRRVEIMDESVASEAPVKHFSNIYIWVNMELTSEMLLNIHSLSKDFYYDRKKELMIIRSGSLDTAVAQAALLLLYSNGKVSFYDLVNNDLLRVYYDGIKKRRVKKALYTILSTAR